MLKNSIVYLMVIILLLFISESKVDAQSTMNQSETNGKNGSEDYQTTIIETTGPVIPAVIGAFATIWVAFRQYKKGKEVQTLEHDHRLEYEYQIDLRKKRLDGYMVLWKLTHVEFNEGSNSRVIRCYKYDLNNWYYQNGNGMLLTESSQKLFSNLKNVVEKLESQWDKLSEKKSWNELINDISLKELKDKDAKLKYTLDKLTADLDKTPWDKKREWDKFIYYRIDELRKCDDLRGEKRSRDELIYYIIADLKKDIDSRLKEEKKIEDFNKILKELYHRLCSRILSDEDTEKLICCFKKEQINRIESIASGLRSSLLKDVGTRGELENLPVYDEIFILEPEEEQRQHSEYVKISFIFVGDQTIPIQNKEIFLHIVNLNENHTIDVVPHHLDRLDPGKSYTLRWNKTSYLHSKNGKFLIPGNYSARIVAGRLTAEMNFKFSLDKEYRLILDK